MALATFVAGSTTAVADDAKPFASATEAYRSGLEAHRSGDAEAALRALEYAADRGVLGAQLRLARMYAKGDGVERSDAKAFYYYQRIADQYADASTLNPVARYVAEAFVAVGRYHQNGIEKLALEPNPVRAADMFRHAASYFGDPHAQYRLAILYLEGVGVNKNPRLAVNWLANAAKKQHAPAQALLGDILWRGREDIPRQPYKGLALLALAQDNAAGDEEVDWIEPLYKRAVGEAEPDVRERASQVLAHWRQRPPGAAEVNTPEDTEPRKGKSGEAGSASSQLPAASTGPLFVPSAGVKPTLSASPSAPIETRARESAAQAASSDNDKR